MAGARSSWLRRLPDGLVVGPATLGPVGRLLPAPGTWGSLAGLLYFAACFRHAGTGGILLASVVGGYLAVLWCGEAEVRLGRSDPGEVILDEFVAMPLCFLGWRELASAGPAWIVMLTGFGLFRFFDILKPLGISRLQDLRGGWGVVADDYAAALAACGSLHVLTWLWVRI